jgi:thiol-disulfide isomerase/thioredoxin
MLSVFVRPLLCAVLLCVATPAFAEGAWLGVEIEKDAAGGVRILDVLPESPLIGLQGKDAVSRGDVILTVDNQPVLSPNELIAVVRPLQVGQRVKLTLRVPGTRPREVEVTLTERIPPEALQIKTLLSKPAPDFVAQGISGPALPAAKGDSSMLTGLRGTPVLLDFFATWCGPCMRAIPELSALQRRHPDLRVIGVSDEPPEVLRPMVSQMQPGYTVAQDREHKAMRAYRIYSYPTLVLVDRGGVVRRILHGDLDALEAAVTAVTQAPDGRPRSR